MTIQEIVKAEDKAMSVPQQAHKFEIASNDDLLKADELLTSWRGIEGEIHAAFDPIVEKAHQAHKEAVAQRKKYLDPIEEGRRILKPKMADWNAAQERIRQEEQKAAEAAALKRAEDEALEMAALAEKSGDKALAETILAQPVTPMPVMVPKLAPKTATRFQVRWYAEVISLKDLCKEIAEGRQPVELVEANMVALNKLAGALKGSLNIPGVVAKTKTV